VSEYLSLRKLTKLQRYAPYWNIANAVFGFPKGSKFLKFVIEALALSFALRPRQAGVLFCSNGF
jgi:hypothetical protein